MHDVSLFDKMGKKVYEREEVTMKKLTVLAAAAILAAVPSTGVFAAGDLTFATGGSSGTYYAFGSVLAGEVSSDTDTTVTAVESNGSADNVDR